MASQFQPRAGDVDEELPLLLVLDDEFCKRFGAVADPLETLGGEIRLGEIWRLHDRGEFRVELLDDGSGRALGREHAEPGLERGLIGRQTRFGEGRHAGHQRIALRPRHQQPLDLTLVDLARDVGIANNQVDQLDVARLERQHGVGRALERHMRHARTGLVLEPLDHQMGVAADAERAEIELVGMRLGIGDQLLEVVDRHALVEDEHLVRKRKVGDRLEILDRIVAQVLVERRVDRDAAAREQADRVAVRQCRLASIGGDDGVGTGAAFHDEAVAVALLERLAERAHHHVDSATRSERDDDVNRRRGISGLGEPRACGKSHTARNQGGAQQPSRRHGVPPAALFFVGCSVLAGG